MTTKPHVFIVESLTFDDEKNSRFEGQLLCKMLNLSGSEPEYMYLRTKQELEEAIDFFDDSEFRYLHISCHGNKNGIDLTLDHLSFDELGAMLRPVLDKKRVFFSSCSVMNEGCANALLNDSGCFSVIGPSKRIYFDRAAIFWSAFYHLMLRDEARSMKHDVLQQTTAKLKDLFSVHIRYFRKSSSDERGFTQVPL